MPKIHLLPDQIINQIAAGEVVERPASVVKELVENALDAGADRLQLELVQGGKQLIKLVDNGSGMDKTDLQLAVKRHATSKIDTWQDVCQLKSLGFRGEALASIAAVSRFVIRSRPSGQETGYQLTVNFGQTGKLTAVGMPAGTQVEVADLFAQLPARLKFVKSASTEYRQIVGLLQALALAFPKVSWQIKHNQKLTFHWPGVNQARQRLEQVLGQDQAEQMLPVRYRDEYVTVQGWLARPQAVHHKKPVNILLVNQRVVSDRMVYQAVRQAMAGLLMTHTRPGWVLQIDLPAEQVDINVHPRKQEVKFASPDRVYQAVFRATKSAWQTANLTFVAHDDPQANWAVSAVVGDSRPAGGASWPEKASRSVKTRHDLSVAESLPWETDAVPVVSMSQTGEILQVMNTYLLYQQDQQLVVVDQHAAAERVLYEQLQADFRQGGRSQSLLWPVDLDLTDEQEAVLVKHQAWFEQLGIKFEKANKGWQVVAVSPLMKDQAADSLVVELLQQLAQVPPEQAIDQTTDQALKLMACRSAVKAGDRLSLPERQQLLAQLDQCQQADNCPHGRPTRMIWTRQQLDKLFKRRL